MKLFTILIATAALGAWPVATFLAPARAPAAVTATPAAVSMREHLSAYWGDRWEHVRPLLRALPCQLDEPFDPSSATPFESVRPLLEPDFVTLSPTELEAHRRDARSWSRSGPDVDRVDFVAEGLDPAHRTLDEEHRRRIREIVAPFDAELDALGVASAEAFVAITRRIWKQESYWRSPHFPVNPPQPAGKRRMLLRSYAVGSWHVSYAIHSGDDPAFDEVWAQIDDVSAARSEAVRRYLESI